MAGAAVAGAVGALVASEFLIDGAGAWWADHPIGAAVLTGALLLALTVLVVEAVVERVLSSTELQRWAPAGRAAAEAVVTSIAAPYDVVQRRVIWPMTFAVENFFTLGAPEDDDETQDPDVAARELLVEARTAVLAVAPVFGATDRLHEIYAHSTGAVSAAGDLVVAIQHWRNVHGVVAPPLGASGAARAEWWSSVMSTWDSMTKHVLAFERLAEDQLGPIWTSNQLPPWHEDEPELIVAARRKLPPTREDHRDAIPLAEVLSTTLQILRSTGL
jgi:hypothetical protein